MGTSEDTQNQGLSFYLPCAKFIEDCGARSHLQLEAHSISSAFEDDEESTVSRLRRVLTSLPDLERGVTRILHKTASPAELLTFLQAFSSLSSKLKMQVRAGLSL